jgi:hypothetical protein
MTNNNSLRSGIANILPVPEPMLEALPRFHQSGFSPISAGGGQVLLRA